MDRYKFRVWHKLDRCYFDPHVRGWKYNVISGQWYVNGMNVTDRVIMEQSTGLKDKNGKEIYEWDLIGGYDPYSAKYKHVCAVNFSDGAFWSSTKSLILVDYIHDFFELNNLEIEVIGNIHDNPELLEG